MTDSRRSALITGSGRNIGRSIALRLARQGFNIVVHGNRDNEAAQGVAREAAALGVEATVAMANLAQHDAVMALWRAARERFGAIDVLVNNAAIRPQSALESLTEEEWHHVFDVNLHSAFSLIKASVPDMKANGWGRIVNFTGMNAIHGYAGRPHVSASKHAIWGMTKALAKELGPAGITVNAISPGPIATEHPDNPGMASHIQDMVSRIPLGRLGTPEEVAALCGFLCSDDGGYVSGQMIACNGAGQT